MQIVRDLAGYSYGRSDLVRRAMAKKKHKIMAQEREYFVHGKLNADGTIDVPGCVRNGVPEAVAEHIYDEMTSFASYAFNKSHAAAYAVVAVQTGWLKRHHPVPFMAAILNSVYGNSGKIAAYIQYCRSRGIAILPPDVNRSGWKFTVTKDSSGQLGILFGLGAVKTVGQNAVAAIMRERENGPFKDIFDFCTRIDTTEVNKRVVESLIRAGAFDFTGVSRAKQLGVFESAMDASISRRKSNVAGQLSLFDMAFGGTPAFETANTYPDVPEQPLRVRLAMEKEVSGVYITGHPLDDYRELLEQFEFTTANLEDLEEREDHGMELDGRYVEMAGILTDVRGKATKKGAMMGFITLEDLTGQVECLVFPKVYERYQGLMAADDLVVLCGKLSIREEEAPKLLLDKLVPLDEWASSPESRSPRDRVTIPDEPGNRPRQAAAAQSRDARTKPHGHWQDPLTDAQHAARAPRKLFIQLDRARMDEAQRLLSLFPGSLPVYLHIPAEKATFLLPKLQWCDASPGCMERLSAAFGQQNVKLVEKKA